MRQKQTLLTLVIGLLALWSMGCQKPEPVDNTPPKGANVMTGTSPGSGTTPQTVRPQQPAGAPP